MTQYLSKKTTFALLGFFGLVTFLYFGPWTLKSPKSVLYHTPGTANSNGVEKPNFGFREQEFDFTANFIRFLRLFSVDYNTPLFILDQNLLNCIHANFRECLSTLEKSDKSYILLGYVDENGLDVEKTISDRFNTSEWATKQKEPGGHVIVKSSNSVRVLVLANMKNKSNYWHVEEIKSISRPAFALPIPPRLKTVDVSDGLAQLVLPDISPRMFGRQLKNSKFLPCNSSLSEKLREDYPAFYEARPAINDSVVQDLAYLRDLLLKIDIPLFLSGGTLLGWYRECGIIPYTTDMDVNILATDYNEKLEETLRNEKKLKLFWRLGKPSDSLEFSVFSGATKFDLFFLYQNPTDDHSWVGGMIAGSRTKLKWIYPKVDELCTGDLLGHLFHVPCNVEAILTADYGARWRVPHHNDKFVWHSSHNNVKQAGHWSSQDWRDVYRIYNQ